MIRPVWFAGLCAALLATAVYAQDHADDMYAGAALGMTWYPQLDEDVGDFDNELYRERFVDLNLLTSSDERALAWSLFAGYAMNDIFAIEVGYLGSGNVSMERNVSGMLDGERLRYDADVQARRWSVYGALIGHVPTDWSVKPFGKIGIRRWSEEIDATTTVELMNTRHPVLYSDQDDGFGPVFGIGADVPMTESASFRVEYLYLPLNDALGGDGHRAHVGMYYAF